MSKTTVSAERKAAEIRPRVHAPIKSQRTFDHTTIIREDKFGPSITKPDKALSIQMILTKHSNGSPLPTVLDMDYTGDSTLPDIRVLDLVERANLARFLKDHIAQVDKEYKEKLQLRRNANAEQRQKLDAALKYYEKMIQAGNDDKPKT